MSVNEPVALPQATRPVPWRMLVLSIVLIISIGAVIARVRLESRVDDLVQEIRDAGLPARGYEIAVWRTLPPDRENGAWALLEACEAIDRTRLTNNPALGNLRGQTNLSPEIALAVVENAEAFKQIEQALTAKRFGFGIDFSEYARTVDAKLPHLDPLRDAANLFWWRSALRSDAGDAEGAADDISRIVRLARALDGEPLLTSVYTRGAILNRASISTARLLSKARAPDAVCQRLIHEFDEAIATNVINPALIGERAIVLDHFAIRWGMAGAPPAGGAPPGQLGGAATRVGAAAITASGIFEREQSFYLQTMRSFMRFATQNPPASLLVTNAMAKAEKTANDKLYLISGMWLYSAAEGIKAGARFTANVLLIRAALAIRRFEIASGRLPAAASELPESLPTDPFDGRSLRYRRTEGGFLLWSVGPDGLDNDGTRAIPARRDPYDLVFSVER